MSIGWRVWLARFRVLEVQLVWAAIFLGLVVLLERPMGTAALWNAVLTIPLVWLSIPWHELGHVIVGRAVGLRALSVDLGIGPRLGTLHLGGVRIRLHALPVAGLTLAAPAEGRGFSRTAHWLMILGGPLFTAAAAGLAYLLSGRGSVWAAYFPRDIGLVVNPVAVGGLVNGLLCLGSLLPVRDSGTGVPHPTDGRLLLSLPFLSKRARREHQVAPFVSQAVDAFREHEVERGRRACAAGLAIYPDSISLRSMDASLALQAGDFRGARESFLAIEAVAETTPGFDRAMRAAMWNNLAWAAVRLGDPALLGEADRYSARSLEALPTLLPAKNTRATVLVKLGRLDEARKLLAEALALADDPVSKAYSLATLAVIEARKGQAAEARRHLDAARSASPTCDLLPEAEAELAAAPDREETAGAPG